VAGVRQPPMSTIERMSASALAQRRLARDGSGVGRRLDGRVSVIVPCFNTVTTIESVLETLLHHSEGVVADVLVIDNHSSDGTADLVETLIGRYAAEGHHVALLRNPENLGYGGSIKRGFASLTVSAPFVAIMHADEQCNTARTLLDLADAYEQDPEPDLVLVSRFMDGARLAGYSPLRTIANRFFNRFTAIVCGVSMSDAGAAIMIARSEAIASLPYERMTSGYQFHPQLNLVLYSDPDLRITEVPLEWRDADTQVKFNLINYGLTLLRILLRFGWRRRVLRRSSIEAVA
jgi:dolichol-phosphate mannosyltransferase